MKRRANLALVALVSGLALASCATTAADRRLAASWTELGNTWAELGKWDQAGKAWKRALDLDPSQGAAGYNLARALAESGDWDGALAAAERVLSRDGENAMVLSIKAYVLHRAGRVDQAIEAYERVLALNGGDADTVLNLAALYESAGRYDEAELRYRELLAAKPDDASLSIRLALVQKELGRPEEALASAEPWFKANPDSIPGLKLAAQLQEAARLFAKAIESLERVTALDKKDAASWFALARLRLGPAADGAAGLEALKKALEAGFIERQALEALANDAAIAAGDEARALIAEHLSGL